MPSDLVLLWVWRSNPFPGRGFISRRLSFKWAHQTLEGPIHAHIGLLDIWFVSGPVPIPRKQGGWVRRSTCTDTGSDPSAATGQLQAYLLWSSISLSLKGGIRKIFVCESYFENCTGVCKWVCVLLSYTQVSVTEAEKVQKKKAEGLCWVHEKGYGWILGGGRINF